MTNGKTTEPFPQDLVKNAQEAAKAVEHLKANTTVQDLAGVDPEHTINPLREGVHVPPGSTINRDLTVTFGADKTAKNLNQMPMVDGQLMPSSFEEAWKVASMMAQSGMVPKQFAGNPAGIMAVLQTAKERGLSPMSALQNMANVNGRVTGFSELPLGEVYRAGIIESFREYWVDAEGKEIQLLDFKTKYFAAVCAIKIKGRELVERVFTLDDARDGGLLTGSTKPDAAWFKYRKRMMQMRARGWALKDAAPDVIAGLPMPEYDEPGDEPGGAPSNAGPSAKEKLSNANRSQAQATGEVTALPVLRPEAGGSTQPDRSSTHQDVQGDAAGPRGQPDPVVQKAPQPAARQRAKGRVVVPADNQPSV